MLLVTCKLALACLYAPCGVCSNDKRLLSSDEALAGLGTAFAAADSVQEGRTFQVVAVNGTGQDADVAWLASEVVDQDCLVPLVASVSSCVSAKTSRAWLCAWSGWD